ncbi:MAG: stage III sporulation protein AC [Oscillospiraceae bacterium]|nr:stage III sporulation protein AC [Oscillospiraceae bacterium]
MNVDLLFQIAGVGILVAVLGQVLKRTGHEDMATIISLAGLVIALLMVVNLIAQLLNSVKSIFQFY